MADFKIFKRHALMKEKSADIQTVPKMFRCTRSIARDKTKDNKL